MNNLKADITEIRRALSVLFKMGDVVELRVLDVAGKTHAGYFNDFDRLANEATKLSGHAAGVYVVLNPIKTDLLARSVNRITISPKNLTRDVDITRRRWLLIDVDPRRPKGISSTDAEHQGALTTAKSIKMYLIDLGFPPNSMIVSDSGNGGHVLIKVDLPNNAESEELLKACLKVIEAKFNNDLMEIDQTVFNTSRICKLPGTMACKGDPTADRPHRIAISLDVPETMTLAPIESIKVLAALAPKVDSSKKTNRTYQGSGQKFDLESWLSQNGIDIKRKDNYEGGYRYILQTCPFNDLHIGTSAAVFQAADGKIGFKCQHNECVGRGWTELRELKEPGYKDRRSRHGEHSKQNAEHGNNTKEDAVIPRLADAILQDNHFAQDQGGKLYHCHDGVYKPRGAAFVNIQVKTLLDSWGELSEWSSHLAAEVVEFIRVDSPILWERPPLDTVNVLNGLLDVNIPKLKPHSPDFLSSIQIPVTYNPNATCPTWDKFISEVFPEDALSLGYEIPAYLMTPDTSIQKSSIIFMGEGGNGKSTYMEAVRAFLGRVNTASLSLQRLESDRFAVARLVGKLANICPDLPSEHLAGTSMFKTITGGDTVTAEYKFRDSFDFVPFARLIFSANHPPQSSDSSQAFFDRWLVALFTARFRGEKKEIPRAVLDTRLASPDELSGVLNKVLIALKQIRKCFALTESKSMKEAWDEFRATTDPLAVWLSETTIENSNAMVSKRYLIAAYNQDAERRGQPRMTDTGFGLALRRLRPNIQEAQRTVVGKVTWVWLGIGLKLNEKNDNNGGSPS